jgi:hypothetical protein
MTNDEKRFQAATLVLLCVLRPSSFLPLLIRRCHAIETPRPQAGEGARQGG